MSDSDYMPLVILILGCMVVITIIQNIPPHISIENSCFSHHAENRSDLILCSQILIPISIPSPATPIITSQVPKSDIDSQELSDAASAAVIDKHERREARRFHWTIVALSCLALFKFIELIITRKRKP